MAITYRLVRHCDAVCAWLTSAVGPPTSGTWHFGVTRQDAHGHEEHAFPIESILRESTDGDGTGREEPTQQRTTQHRAASAVAKSCQAQGVATPPCHRHQRIPLYLDVRPKGARPPPLANVPKRQERRPVRKGKRAPHCRCALHSMSMSVSSASSTTSVPSSNRPKQKNVPGRATMMRMAAARN